MGSTVLSFLFIYNDSMKIPCHLTPNKTNLICRFVTCYCNMDATFLCTTVMVFMSSVLKVECPSVVSLFLSFKFYFIE